jgi:DNA-3-methyladenine glycosylase I
MKDVIRCRWASSDPLMMKYHDQEWGIPLHDDEKLFEMLILEGAQAGLSWLTVLKKRAQYQKLFANFQPEKIARFSASKVEKILLDPGIIRNRLKVESTVSNAQAFLAVKKEWKTFSAYIWHFVNYQPIDNKRKSHAAIPASDAISDKMSKDMKKRGFRFIVTTICYAFMQAVGLVNDHTADCFCYKTIKNNKMQRA